MIVTYDAWDRRRWGRHDRSPAPPSVWSVMGSGERLRLVSRRRAEADMDLPACEERMTGHPHAVIWGLIVPLSPTLGSVPATPAGRGRDSNPGGI